MKCQSENTYNSSAGVIEGLEDYGDGVMSENIADHALVFMAQGVGRSWKQPLAYYLSHGPVKAEKLSYYR